MGRTHPTECRHGVVIDWGDFGPCQNCDEHPDTDDCPNLRDCLTCAEESGSSRSSGGDQ